MEWVRQYGSVAQSLGHEIEVVSLDSPNAPWLETFPLPTHAMGHYLKNFYSPQLYSWLKAHANNYDVIIVHGLWRYASFGTWRALHTMDIPYFVYTHGMLDPWFKQFYPIKHLGKWLYWPWTDYRVLRDARGVIFTCEQERDKARESFWYYKCNEMVSTIGIQAPPEANDRQKEIFFKHYPEAKNKRVFLFLGRIHPKKGCDILIEAFARSNPVKHNLHLVFAGPDHENWIPSLKKLVDRLDISQHVTWTGMISGDLKWGAFRLAEAFMLPSHQENFGISVVEAMACNLPVLISTKVDIHAEIKEDYAGLVADDTIVGTENLFRNWLALSKEEHALIGHNAQISFLKRFEIGNATQHLLNLLMISTR